jgi:hypothetical protein
MPEGMTAEKLRTLAEWFDTYDAIIEQVIFTLDGEEATDGKALVAVRGKDVQEDLRRWADDIDRWLTHIASPEGSDRG